MLAPCENRQLSRLIPRRWLRPWLVFGHRKPGSLEYLPVSPVADQIVMLAHVARRTARGEVAFVVGATAAERDDVIDEIHRRPAVGAGSALQFPAGEQPVELSSTESGCG